MAAECPLSERRIVEIKMGRSKFPGKPSKIGNRKRVNLSSCALPEENESSKAAENIYLGLSMFNEAFGDNEMVPPGPFYGFSVEDVEDALAEARLQQRESEVEYKKQGISVNLQDSLQNELTSLGYFSLNRNHDKNKIRLCFDGGGSMIVNEPVKSVTQGLNKNSDFKPSNINKVTSNLNDNNDDKVIDLKHEVYEHSKNKILCETITSANTSNVLMCSKLSRKPDTFKRLQSLAAKKLLQKAKLSNMTDGNKSNNCERKFVLPTYSMHSLRVIKPSKKFIEDFEYRKEKLLRAKMKKKASQKASRMFKNKNGKSAPVILLGAELRVEVSDCLKNKTVKDDKDGEGRSIAGKDVSYKLNKNNSLDSVKTNVHHTTTGKFILREPKLQLNKINVSLREGPFSASSQSSSLSPNSQMNSNTGHLSTVNRTITCGVCGSVKFYEFVELAKKFGIYCCEPCQKFISNIIMSVESEKSYKFQCSKGKGLCIIPTVMNSQPSSKSGMECQACWLKLCLKKFKISSDLKSKLLELLPVDMQFDIDLYSAISKDDANSFAIVNNSVKDFKWLNQNDPTSDITKRRGIISIVKDSGKKEFVSNDPSPVVKKKQVPLRQANGRAIPDVRKKYARHKGRSKLFSDNVNRQKINLKGPRVKNVCRSASIVLGQPMATFPLEFSPRKETLDIPCESSKNCDEIEATNGSCTESQGVLLVCKNNEIPISEKRQFITDKKSSIISKQIANAKPSSAQQSSIGRKKKNTNVKAENPISIDFWETYDPEEVSESGFGLIGSENFSVRALCFLCGSSGQEKLIHCASCCEPYHEFCVNEELVKLQDDVWKYDWICPRCTVCVTCGKTSGQQLKCVKCDNSYHTECVDRVGGRLLHSPDRPWVCSVCLRCRSCNGVDVSVFVGNLPLCRTCFFLRQKGNYCPLCQRCYEDDDYDSKMMECGQCKCWVHAKCEGLSDEKYQVLSFLPESVEYICRMCCVMPPAPWWIAVEAELKSGYLGVLKALSKNRKACAMLKWSPKKQCTCRQVNFTPRALDFEEVKSIKTTESSQNKGETVRKSELECTRHEKLKTEISKPSPVLERKTSIEVINRPTDGSLKLTLKIVKGADEEPELGAADKLVKIKDMYERFKIKECSVRVKKCPLIENTESIINLADFQEDSQDKSIDFSSSSVEHPEKRSLSSPVNPSSDSGIGSTDDELKMNSLTDEESCKNDEQHSHHYVESKVVSEPPTSLFEDKNECICFLEVDSYNSRSKPFSPSLLSIKKKVTTSEYSSLQQFHMDMQRMIATTQSSELMEMYHQTVKEIFPWFDPKFSRVYTSNSQKISDTASPESTSLMNTPTKCASTEECKVPRDKLVGQPSEYYYSGFVAEDNRSCLMCKGVGDGPPSDTGRLIYCGQNEWVHCNCALWSAEVFEEIDGSLQNVHSAINRGRSIRCAACGTKGASIGCCARNCAETFHFTCARKVGCAFMDDKTVFCPAHISETKGKVVQNEKEFEIRRPVYVELDKRKMKSVDSSQVRFAVGGLHIENLGRFVTKLSDQPDAIIPDQFQCTRLFWSCYEPWKIVKYHFSVRVQEDEEPEGVDFGINLTVDHSEAPEILELKLKQLKYFQEHQKLLHIDEALMEEKRKKRKLNDQASDDGKIKSDEAKMIPSKKPKKDGKITVDLFDPKEDETCLSDSQNTADLIPPELEEAIFKDLTHDILDGISMQDIFMDIKTDLYENGEKEGRDLYDSLEVEEIVPTEQVKTKKIDISSDSNTQSDFGLVSDDSKHSVYEWTDEIPPKLNRDLKRSRSDILPSRRNMTLKSSQRSCSLNWNCKMDIHTTKWKKNSKCHTTLLEPQERGNMLQELKFTDGLVVVSTDTLPSVKELKDRLAIQQDEGKENKCLGWNVKLQPRLLQVDGGVDSSSSGSEAGESPQRLMEESMLNTKNIPQLQPSPYSTDTSFNEMNTQMPSDFSYLSSSFNLPQVDGVDDTSSDDSDYDCRTSIKSRTVQCNSTLSDFKVSQLDGSADSGNEGRKVSQDEVVCLSVDNNSTDDEPVKCNQCHCTYRTRISYERHLENCSNDFILFSSDGEGSEEENSSPDNPKINVEDSPKNVQSESNYSPEPDMSEKPSNEAPQQTTVESAATKVPAPVKKVRIKRLPPRRRPNRAVRRASLLANSQNMQRYLVQQTPIPPTVIVQDMGQPNIVPGAFIDAGSAIPYVTSFESQNAFTKPQLIATPGTLMPNSFHIQTPESQLIPGLPVLQQNVQPNLPGIIIQQPQVAGTLISPQPTPIVMPSDQVMLGAPPLLEVIHDPQTGGMYWASHNQPVFYNMETVVSNTVMQTNQYVSNVVTGSSFTQTSTQVVQTSKLEQIMNVPPNYVFVGQNPTSEKIMSSPDLICVPPSQPLMQNQQPVPTVVNPIIQAPQPFNTEPNIVSPSVNPTIQCVQTLHTNTPCSPVLNKPSGSKVIRRNREVMPRITPTSCSENVIQSKPHSSNSRSMPMMRPNVTKSPPREFEKAVITPKTQKPGRAIVDFINNFKSEHYDASPALNNLSCEQNESTFFKEGTYETSPEKESWNATSEVPHELKPPMSPLSIPSELNQDESSFKYDTITIEDNTPDSTQLLDESEEIILKIELEKKEEEEMKLSEECISETLAEAKHEESVNKEAADKECDTPHSLDESVIEINEDVSESEGSESILPLQETSPSTNNTTNFLPKSPDGKNDTLKETSKLFSSNQNCVATKLVTIHPRLIQSPEGDAESENKKRFFNGKAEDKGPKLIFDVTSDDGFKSSSTSMAELWAKICDSVQEMRAVFKIPPLPISRKGHEILGMQNHGLQHCLEQLRGVEQCVKYKCKYFVKERKADERLMPVKENLTGCARTETYCDRKEYDMFAWLGSRHRRLPNLTETSEEVLSSARRANSLPMAMRYRHLRETAKTYVGVYRSKIHGKGLFCLREIEAGEMVIEYAGEVIRSNITDKREKYYTDKGIGCYMFRIDDHFVVDATMKGNAARFINHSCEPNCYSRVVDILGKKHIVIFALRRIRVMEELTYDYKFPFEDEKISCHCLSKKCRKYLN